MSSSEENCVTSNDGRNEKKIEKREKRKTSEKKDVDFKVLESDIQKYDERAKSVTQDLESLIKRKYKEKCTIFNQQDLNSKVKGQIHLYYLQELNEHDDNNIWIAKDVTGHEGSVFKVYFKKNEDFTLVCSVDEMGKRIENKGESNAGIIIKYSQTRKEKEKKTKQPVKSEPVKSEPVKAKAELYEKSVSECTSHKRRHDQNKDKHPLKRQKTLR
jgi:hypothetical protein